ncbi:hypothetical protein ACXYMU_15905 [Pontibacter sp. CAU 1760]
MTAELANRVDTLAAYANKKGVSWQDDAKQLPPGDHVAVLGLLADRLGIPLPAALDEQVTEEDLEKLSGKEED